MKDSFAKRLMDKIESYNNPSLLGLDPNLTTIPKHILENLEKEGFSGAELVAKGFEYFNRSILEELSDLVCAVKFQSACYEQYGEFGVVALKNSLNYAKELGFITLIDSKRNDIGSSAVCYARAGIGESPLLEGSYSALGADAITLNAYLGIDGIRPFLELLKEEGKGCFILVRTSNPSAGDLQDLELQDGRTIYQATADLVAKWGDAFYDEACGFSSLGAVVGATWPLQAQELRERMPRQIFLIPGYGAQGGSAKDAVAGFKDGKGGLVNASRSLMLAYQRFNYPERDFAKASRDAAIEMKKDLLEALKDEKN